MGVLAKIEMERFKRKIQPICKYQCPFVEATNKCILYAFSIRITFKVSFDSHTDVFFKEQEILKFSEIYLYHIGKFMH